MTLFGRHHVDEHPSFLCLKITFLCGLMMVNVPVITLSLVFVLQVLSGSVEESQPRLDCGSLCEQVDSGLAGVCCGKMKSEKC